MRVEGTLQIGASLAHLVSHTAVVEMRVLGGSRVGTASGYFDAEHRQALAQACSDWSGRAAGVYVTVNPVRADLLARAQNRVRTWAKQTTADQDVLHRVCFPIDFDPKRPSGISATEGEHQSALVRALDCRKFLSDAGWPEPLYVDSGNGSHLIYAIDVPNDSDGGAILKHCLQAVALHFDDEIVAVDLTTHNAARILRVPGTLNCKGDSIPERPHRLARLIEAPITLIPVPVDLLQRLASVVEPPPDQCPQPSRKHSRSFDLAQWVAEHKLPVVMTRPWKGGTLWVLSPCPWNPDHTNKAAFVLQFANGAIAAGCHHSGCSGKGWPELRDVYEPGWRERRSMGKTKRLRSVVVEVQW